MGCRGILSAVQMIQCVNQGRVEQAIGQPSLCDVVQNKLTADIDRSMLIVFIYKKYEKDIV